MNADERTSAHRDDLARRKLLGILSSSWTAQAVYSVVKLGVADLLADGPQSAASLAESCGADVRALARVLRALALMGLFSQPEPGVFALTPTSTLLRADVPGSVRSNALLQGEEIFRSFADIMHTMRTGQPAFAKVYGRPFYDYLGEHPVVADIFNESMGDQAAPESLATCDFAAAKVVVDVGGGDGRLLGELLQKHQHLRGILVELPDAIRKAREELARVGLTDRVECVTGSFFAELPTDGDTYVLSRVLHNWTDANALEILRQAHVAMRPGARLIVLEDLLPEGDTGATRSAAGLIDLLMLVTLEGWDRTETEYRELLAKAGFGSITARRARESAVGGVLEAIRS